MNSTTPTTPLTPTASGAEGDGEPTAIEKATADKTADTTADETADKPADTTADKPMENTAEQGLDPERNLDLDDDEHEHDDEHELDDEKEDEKESSGLATAAAAVVSVGLGIVSLSGAWSGRVAAERETLIGQFKTSSGASAAQQISEIYGDAWHATALVNGLFGLLALLVGVYVLVRPAFGAPSPHPQPGWIRAIAKGGIALGVLGVLIAVCMYFDLIVALPTAPAAAG